MTSKDVKSLETWLRSQSSLFHPKIVDSPFGFPLSHLVSPPQKKDGLILHSNHPNHPSQQQRFHLLSGSGLEPKRITCAESIVTWVPLPMATPRLSSGGCPWVLEVAWARVSKRDGFYWNVKQYVSPCMMHHVTDVCMMSTNIIHNIKSLLLV